MATPPDFTAGQVLTAAQMNAVGLWLVKTQTIGTAVASVEVTNAFSSDYKAYKIIVQGASASANNALILQLGPTSVSGYNSGYYRGAVLINYATAAVTGSNDNNNTQWASIGAHGTTGWGANFDLIGPNESTRTLLTFANAAFFADVGITGGGYHNSTNQFTSFFLKPASGTFTGGTVYVYGYRD